MGIYRQKGCDSYDNLGHCFIVEVGQFSFAQAIRDCLSLIEWRIQKDTSDSSIKRNRPRLGPPTCLGPRQHLMGSPHRISAYSDCGELGLCFNDDQELPAE